MSEKILLWKKPVEKEKTSDPSITLFLLKGTEEHPCVLIVPGGGYGGVCESTEGSPVAHTFNRLGFHAAVLNYRVAPHRYPEPQADAMRAMKILRGNAREWHINPTEISVCGFSAGAHLAASLGTICEGIDASDGDRYDAMDCRPDFMILCYGVLTFDACTHEGTMVNLLGERTAQLREVCSPEKHITGKTPPAFIWHTFSDQVVPFRNSVLFAEAMHKAGRPCELRIFPYGAHGMLLGMDTTDVGTWPEAAAAFMKTVRMPEELQKERYTNRYQAEQISKTGLFGAEK